MPALIVDRNESGFTIQVTVPYNPPMLDFVNQSSAGRMDYASRVAAKEPIGSGVTEAACKVIVKQRLCNSGMKKEPGAAAVLSPRCLSHTPERWAQFWAKVDRWGFPVAA